jgi:hypothetical protein
MNKIGGETLPLKGERHGIELKNVETNNSNNVERKSMENNE